MTEETLQELIKCNGEALNCLANLEAFGRLDEGALLGAKDWLREQQLLLNKEKEVADTPTLSDKPARLDLTDRECAKFFSATAGVLVQMASVNDVRRGALWTANADEFWKILSYQPMSADQVKLRRESEKRRK